MVYFFLVINTLLLLVLACQRQMKLSTLYRMEKILMGVTEDLATLNAQFDGIESAVLVIADDIAAYVAEIREANERANIDLSPLIARAEGIETRLRGVAGPNPGTDPVEPPV